MQASLKKNEGFVYQSLFDKRKKTKPKKEKVDLVRTADIKRTFWKRDLTNWSYKLYKITEITNDTLPSNCKIAEKLGERINEALLKKTELSMKKTNNLWKL